MRDCAGLICHQCNAFLIKNRVLSCYSHNGSNFDTKILLCHLETAAAKKHIKKIKVFGKESDSIIKLTVEFYCYLCFPDDLPVSCPDFAILGQNSAIMKETYENEFQELMGIVQTELNSEEHIDIEDRMLEDDETEDETEDEFNVEMEVDDFLSQVDEASAGAKKFDYAEAEDTVLEKRKIVCPHRRFYNMRTVDFKDSFLLIRSSLEKSTEIMVNNTIQKSFCSGSPNLEGSFDTDVCIDSVKKSCACCVDLNHLPSACPEVLEFAKVCLGDIRRVDFILKKMKHYPYALHDLGLEQMIALQALPSRDLFQNSLKDDRPITDEEYQDFLNICSKMAISESYSLMLSYLLIDVMTLSMLLHFSSKYMMKTFNLNLLEYSSISKYAFDLIIDDACKVIGQENGIEYIQNEELFSACSKAVFGGFLASTEFGRVRETNNIYQDDFDPDTEQSFILPIDKTSHYGKSLTKPMPYTNLEYHDANSSLVKKLNSMLDAARFIDFLRRAGNSRYYLIEVLCHFPASCQTALIHFPPLIWKARIQPKDLSSHQRALMTQLSVEFNDTNPVNVMDFADQRQSLSLEYLEVLRALGVEFQEIYSCVTAFAFPIFSRIVDKLLDLKVRSKNPFSRSWLKLLANSR